MKPPPHGSVLRRGVRDLENGGGRWPPVDWLDTASGGVGPVSLDCRQVEDGVDFGRWPHVDADRLPSGYVMAAWFAVCGWVSFLLILFMQYPKPGTLEVVLFGLMTAILVAGYIAGLAAAIYRPTRRRGFQMLMGFTLMLPVAVVLFTWTGWAIYGGG